MSSHGHQGLKIYGNAPEIEQLQNGRYRQTLRMDYPSRLTTWWYDNKDQLFKDYGTLYDAAMKADGWTPADGEVYPDMLLIDAGLEYTPTGKHVLKFVYETVTSSWVQTKDDTVDYELNGLRRVTRQSIATVSTDYTSTVGTSTITDDSVSLTLGTYSIDERDSHLLLTEVWIEEGILRVSEVNQDEGVVAVTTTFLGAEGATVGPVVSRRTDNYEGLTTVTVTTLQDKNGNSIVGTDPNLVHQYQTKRPFEYPGIAGVTLETETIGGTGSSLDISSGVIIINSDTEWQKHVYYYDLTTNPPITTPITVDVFVFYQTENDVLGADETYGSATSFWAPDTWAVGKKTGLGTNFSLTSMQPINQTQVLHKYTTNTGTQSYTGTGGTGVSEPAIFIEGAWMQPEAEWTISVSGGPGIPDGGTYTLDIQIRPAFEDVDGNIYYKKTIISATIPTR